MEMEHINENLIKVMIDAADLQERGIDFLDLIGDQASIEQFFYSILEEVDIDQEFQGSDAVTFQVMPNQDGLELYISRSNFDDMGDFLPEEFKQQRALMHQKRHTSKDDAQEKLIEAAKEEIEAELTNEHQLDQSLFLFKELDDFIDLARILPDPLIKADLYAADPYYVLYLKDAGYSDSETLNHLYFTLVEYSEVGCIRPEVLKEYGQLIRSEDALAYFGMNF